MIKTKRAYERPEKSDGCRILVDRLWPRGLKKSAAHFDLWLKGIGPSNELRHWFGHEPSKWPEFRKKYFRELAAKKALVEEILARENKGTVTFVYSARDTEHNNAVALQEYISRMLVAA